MKRITFLPAFITAILLLSGCVVNNHSKFSKSKTFVQVGEKSKKAIQLEFKTIVNAPVETVWSELKNERFWISMFKPRVNLKPKDTIPALIKGNQEVYKLVINGFILFGKHYILWETVDDDSRTIQTRENGGYVKVWDNMVVIEKVSDSSCVIIDQLTLRGGILTGPTSTWAKGVLNKRHKNFRKYFLSVVNKNNIK